MGERSNIHIIGVSVGEERENGTEEIIGKNGKKISKPNKWHKAAELRRPKIAIRFSTKNKERKKSNKKIWKAVKTGGIVNSCFQTSNNNIVNHLFNETTQVKKKSMRSLNCWKKTIVNCVFYIYLKDSSKMKTN